MTEEIKKEEEAVEVPEKFKKLVGEIEQMSVLDLAELVKVLEKKFGVSSATPMVMVAAGGVAGGAPATEEKSSFNVELKAAGDKKIEVIKAVRDLTG
ncbi:MAG: 50S ribosomal protein L7/L12, partial [Candidatus Nealsonbacteria bacterium CG_4_8_14_3_um_filter_39_7]